MAGQRQLREQRLRQAAGNLGLAETGLPDEEVGVRQPPALQLGGEMAGSGLVAGDPGEGLYADIKGRLGGGWRTTWSGCDGAGPGTGPGTCASRSAGRTTRASWTIWSTRASF